MGFKYSLSQVLFICHLGCSLVRHLYSLILYDFRHSLVRHLHGQFEALAVKWFARLPPV